MGSGRHPYKGVQVKMSKRWMKAFLARLAEAPNVSEACRAVKIGRQTAYDRREVDPEFAKAWDDAIEQSTDDLVGEMYRRARKGTRKPVFHNGKVCGHIREYSDTLAIVLAKAYRPALFRETKRLEHTGPGGMPMKAYLAFDPNEV